MSELILPYKVTLAHLGFKIKSIWEETKENASAQDTPNVTFRQNSQASPYETEKQNLL